MVMLGSTLTLSRAVEVSVVGRHLVKALNSFRRYMKPKNSGGIAVFFRVAPFSNDSG